MPFAYYQRFVAHNGLDSKIQAVVALARRDGSSREELRAALKQLRRGFRRGEMPPELAAKLAETHALFPSVTSLRCRSSTNNEDLPGFSGAGLYGSFTHRPDEGHLSKSIQQVYATLWSERAFEEREFYRVDHAKTAMGVLLHQSFKNERANGVAVSLDVLYRREGYNYVNVQVGDDMVTNPEGRSVPEEILLPWRQGAVRRMQDSNRVTDGGAVLSEKHLAELKRALETIHDEFAELYGTKPENPRFAMEIEFKVTAGGDLVIKQARPWVFPAEPKPK